jgi:hypothetical protein
MPKRHGVELTRVFPPDRLHCLVEFSDRSMFGAAKRAEERSWKCSWKSHVWPHPHEAFDSPLRLRRGRRTDGSRRSARPGARRRSGANSGPLVAELNASVVTDHLLNHACAVRLPPALGSAQSLCLAFGHRLAPISRSLRSTFGALGKGHYVCFWHKADIPRLSSNVRFWV